MFCFRSLAATFLLALICFSSADARNRKGDKLLKEGREAETRKLWENALDLYEKALLEDPGEPAYMMSARRVRFQAGMARVDAGQKLRTLGQLEAALAEFQRAFAIDPSSGIAEQEIKRTRQMIEREKTPGAQSATPEERGLTPSERATAETEARSTRMLSVPELRPINRQISTLKMNNQPVKILFETVGKLAGINVVFDPEYQPPAGNNGGRYTVDLSNTSIEQALDDLAVQTKAFWKPLSPNTIFVTSDNPNKRRDYEDYVVKVVYVRNAVTVQELQELSVTLRSVIEIRRAFVYGAMNAILLRGTTDQVALAEKLLHDLDKPRPEVVVDVIVMENNRGRLREIAAGLSGGIDMPATFTGGSLAGTEDSPSRVVRINDINSIGLGDFSTAVPGLLLKLFMNDSQSRIIQQPQVRAVDGQKASLRIGDRVPFASGQLSPGIGGVGGGTNFVSTQFQYIDTGVNVDITPKVHGRDEVSLHVEIDLNNVIREVELGGVSQPVITQKKIIHDIRLKEGEVNLLGGLLGIQDSRSVSGLPGLASIPIIGRLFGPESVEKNRGELLIALIPHIVRAPDFTESNLRSISAGNDQNIKLNYAPAPEPAPAAAAPSSVPAFTTPATPQGAVPIAPAPTVPPPGSVPIPATPAPQPMGARLFFNPSPVQTALNSTVTVQLMVDNVTDLFTAPLKIKYDPKVLRLTGVRPGGMLTSDGTQVNFNEITANDTGEASVMMNRLPGTPTVSGSGPIVNFTFQAVGKGNSTVTVTELEMRNKTLAQIPATLPTMAVTVQ